MEGQSDGWKNIYILLLKKKEIKKKTKTLLFLHVSIIGQMN